MSAQEIIAELPKLSRPELETVDARLHELLQGKGGDTFAESRRNHHLLEATEAAVAGLEPLPDATAGGLLDYLNKHCLGVSLISPERRSVLRAGRGRRSNRRR